MRQTSSASLQFEGTVDAEEPTSITPSQSGTTFAQAGTKSAPAVRRSIDTTTLSADGLTAIAVRDVGRVVAAQTSDDDYSALINRHRELAKKVVFNSATDSQRLELQLVRWEIDRIEDARESTAKAILDTMLAPQRELARKISGLVNELTKVGVIRKKKDRLK